MARERTAEALWSELEDAEAALEAMYPSPEALRQEAAEAERLAQVNGVPAKSAKAIASLKNKWDEFLVVHGEHYEFDDEVRVTYC